MVRYPPVWFKSHQDSKIFVTVDDKCVDDILELWESGLAPLLGKVRQLAQSVLAVALLLSCPTGVVDNIVLLPVMMPEQLVLEPIRVSVQQDKPPPPKKSWGWDGKAS